MGDTVVIGPPAAVRTYRPALIRGQRILVVNAPESTQLMAQFRLDHDLMLLQRILFSLLAVS